MCARQHERVRSLCTPASTTLTLSFANALLQLPKAVSLLPRHSLNLFLKCAAYGTPVLGSLPTTSGALCSRLGWTRLLARWLAVLAFI